jgi:hypothetical protein
MDKIEIPKVILADKTKMDYQEYLEFVKTRKNQDNKSNGTENTTAFDDDVLPF